MSARQRFEIGSLLSKWQRLALGSSRPDASAHQGASRIPDDTYRANHWLAQFCSASSAHNFNDHHQIPGTAGSEGQFYDPLTLLMKKTKLRGHFESTTYRNQHRSRVVACNPSTLRGRSRIRPLRPRSGKKNSPILACWADEDTEQAPNFSELLADSGLQHEH